jgi:hypothetical protein
VSKGLAIVAAVLVLLLAAPLLYLDSLAKGALEEGASETFGTPTTLGSVSLGLFSGKLGLARLRVANPEGWQAERFFSIDDGRFGVGLRQFLEPAVEVPSLVLEDVYVSLERRGSQSNYGTVLAHVRKGASPSSDEPGKRFVIRDLRILDVKADVRLEVPGGVGNSFEVRIPEIRLRDAGSSDQGGMLASQLWSTVLRAVLVAVVREGVAGSITRDLAGSLGRLGALPVEVLGEVTRIGGDTAAGAGLEVGKHAGREVGKQLGEAAGGALGAGEAAGSAVKRGIGGLLGREE